MKICLSRLRAISSRAQLRAFSLFFFLQTNSMVYSLLVNGLPTGAIFVCLKGNSFVFYQHFPACAKFFSPEQNYP